MTQKELVSKIRNVVKNDEKEWNERMQSGKEFNLFFVMNLQEKETLHSACIAELLNPEGWHGQGRLFIEKFLNIVFDSRKQKDNEFINAFINQDINISTELPVGNINADYTKGGQLDIIIKTKDEKKAIVIENKIYAKDQHRQLLRYKNYLESEKKGKNPGLELLPKNYRILYLTLDGHYPSEESTGKITGERNEYFTCISYKDHISKWLGECIKGLNNKQNLKDSLIQYKGAVDDIVGVDFDKEKYREIIDLIKETDNLKIAEKLMNKDAILTEKENSLLKSIIAVVKEEILNDADFVKGLNSIANKYNLNLCNDYDIVTTLNNQYGGFYFRKDNSNISKSYICFEFNKPNYQGLYYGLWNPNWKKKQNKRREYKTSDKWPAWNWINGKEEDSSWGPKEFSNPNDMLDLIAKRMDELLLYMEKNNLEKYL